MRRWLKRGAVALLSVVVLGTVGLIVWARVARYDAFPEAVAVASAAERVRGWYVFAPTAAAGAGATRTGLIFYPGGLVDPVAYAPLLRRLADEGILSVLVPMPLDLAVLGIGRAGAVVAAFPEIDRWLIAGHSLGGAMASEFVRRGTPGVEGLVLLASYPAASSDLSLLPIRAVSTYGTENGVTQPEGFEASLERLPPGTELVVIDGGNHAGFGHYGPQSGDGVASIDRDEQQRQTVATILAFVRGFD